MQAKTSQGNIRIVDVNSPRKVDLKTSQGNINITGSNAPAWKLKTSMGNIDVRGTQGQMETKASMGSVRVL